MWLLEDDVRSLGFVKEVGGCVYDGLGCQYRDAEVVARE